jgi:hypothetical protein
MQGCRHARFGIPRYCPLPWHSSQVTVPQTEHFEHCPVPEHSEHRRVPSPEHSVAIGVRGLVEALLLATQKQQEEARQKIAFDQLTGWSAFCDQVAEEREAHEQRLRLTWEHEDDFDPLLGEIAAARCWRQRRGCGC